MLIFLSMSQPTQSPLPEGKLYYAFDDVRRNQDFILLTSGTTTALIVIQEFKDFKKLSNLL